MKGFIVFLTVAILSQVTGETPNTFFCISNYCFTALQKKADFQTALKTCKEINGDLMTVRSQESNDAIVKLLNNRKGNFWIGLQFSQSGCTDISLGLRRYEWVSGHNITDFANWKSNEKVCARRCVSISNDLKWTERLCDDEVDGFLCESYYERMCEPQVLEETDVSISYTTVWETRGEEGSRLLPPGSISMASPSGIKHICLTSHWIKAPWSCEVLQGGCEHKCVNGRCICPPGQAIQMNNVTCVDTPNDPCVNSTCEHSCIPKVDGHECVCQSGYKLKGDGKCEDINECRDERLCPNKVCVNTLGSFVCKCPAGFKQENNKCIDIDECMSMPCEHECTNFQGGYSCSCYEGYIQKRDDFQKCELHCPAEECPAICDPNYPKQCLCPEGFLKDERDQIYCVDINECVMNFCDQGCENTFGSYVCSCTEGYTLVDGYACKQDVTPTLTSPFFTPTTNAPTTSAVTPGGLLAIIVCVVIMILILVFLVHQIMKRHTKWNAASDHKTRDEDMQDLQQVTTQKYNKNLHL